MLPVVPCTQNFSVPTSYKFHLNQKIFKALNHSGETFKEIRSMFPNLSVAKVTVGVLIVLKVSQKFASEGLENKMCRERKKKLGLIQACCF